MKSKLLKLIIGITALFSVILVTFGISNKIGKETTVEAASGTTDGYYASVSEIMALTEAQSAGAKTLINYGSTDGKNYEQWYVVGNDSNLITKESINNIVMLRKGYLPGSVMKYSETYRFTHYNDSQHFWYMNGSRSTQYPAQLGTETLSHLYKYPSFSGAREGWFYAPAAADNYIYSYVGGSIDSTHLYAGWSNTKAAPYFSLPVDFSYFPENEYGKNITMCWYERTDGDKRSIVPIYITPSGLEQGGTESFKKVYTVTPLTTLNLNDAKFFSYMVPGGVLGSESKDSFYPRFEGKDKLGSVCIEVDGKYVYNLASTDGDVYLCKQKGNEVVKRRLTGTSISVDAISLPNNDVPDHVWIESTINNVTYAKDISKNEFKLTVTGGLDKDGKNPSGTYKFGDKISFTADLSTTCAFLGWDWNLGSVRFDYTAMIDASSKTVSFTMPLYPVDFKLVTKFEHTFDEVVPAKEPTCTEAGHIAYKECLECHQKFAVDAPTTGAIALSDISIAPLGHDSTVHVDEVASTCTSHGVKEHLKCSRCDVCFDPNDSSISWTESDMELPYTSHEYGELIDAVAASCITPGKVAHYTCSVCNKNFDENKNEISTIVAPALGHDYGKFNNRVDPQVAIPGTLGYYECSRCQNHFDENHSYLAEIRIAPLWPNSFIKYTKDRVIIRYNEKDKDYFMTLNIKCKNGSYSVNVSKDQNITLDCVEGLTDFSNAVITLDVTNNENKYTYRVEEATNAHYVTVNNGYTEYQLYIPNEKVKVTAGNPSGYCSFKGWIVTQNGGSGKYNVIYSDLNKEIVEFTMGDFDIFFSAEFFDEHVSDGVWVDQIDATCEKTGTYGHSSCTNCHKYLDKDGHTIEDLTIAALGHSLGDLIPEVHATCEEDGVKAHYDCSVCHKHFDADDVSISLSDSDLVISATGHKLSGIYGAIAATCISKGNVDYRICKNCGEYFTANGEAKIENPITEYANHKLISVAEVSASVGINGCKAHDHCTVCQKDFIGLSEVSSEDLVIPALLCASTVTYSDEKIYVTYDENDKQYTLFVIVEYTLNGNVISQRIGFGEDIVLSVDYFEGLEKFSDSKIKIVCQNGNNTIEKSATLQQVYNVNVVNGLCEYKTYRQGETVTVKVNIPADKCKFNGWQVSGVVISESVLNDQTITFKMPANAVSFEAQFIDSHSFEASDVFNEYHVHSVDATCEAGGNVEYYICKNCGVIVDSAQENALTSEQTKTKALGHDFGDLIAEVSPTCTDDGVHAHYECSRCHVKFATDKSATYDAITIVMTKTGHQMGALIPEVSSTCISTGVEAHYHCSKCDCDFADAADNTKLEDLTIAISDHKYGSLIDKVEPLVGVDGVIAHYKCSVCEKTFNTDKEEVTDLSIKMLNAATIITYSKDRIFIDYKDSDKAYKLELVVQYGKKKYSLKVITSTTISISDTQLSITDFNDCNISLVTTNTINDVDYVITKDAVLATDVYKITFENCYAEYEYYKAGEKVTITAKLSDSDGKSKCMFEQFSDSNGLIGPDDYKKTSVTITMPENAITVTATFKGDHVFSNGYVEEVPATCTTAGIKGHYECDNCHSYFESNKETVIVDLEIKPLGHTYGEYHEEIPATCGAEGQKGYYECLTCHKYFDNEDIEVINIIIPALSHEYKRVDEVLPTCEHTGIKGYYVCKNCGKIFNSSLEEIDKESLITDSIDHDYGIFNDRVEPTFEKEGYLGHYECSMCHKYFDRDKKEMDSIVIPMITFDIDGYYTPDRIIISSEINKELNIKVVYELNGVVLVSVPLEKEELKLSDFEYVDSEGKKVCPTDFRVGKFYFKGFYNGSEVTKVIEESKEKYYKLTLVDAVSVYEYYFKYEFVIITANRESSVCTFKQWVTNDELQFDNLFNPHQTFFMPDYDLTLEAEYYSNHDLVKHEKVDATCENDGSIEYYECSHCHRKFVYQDRGEDISILVEITDTSIPVISHDFGNLVKEVKATCEHTGTIAHFVCENCGKIYDIEKTHELNKADLIIPITNHILKNVEYKTPTCEENGCYSHDECAVCKKIFKDGKETTLDKLSISAIGHSYSGWGVVKSPTETLPGAISRTCQNDSSHVEYFEIPALSSTVYVVEKTDPTCYVDGKLVYKYTHSYLDDGVEKTQDVYIRFVLVAAHTFVNIDKVNATCTEDGCEAHQECSVCSSCAVNNEIVEKSTLIISALGHEYGGFEVSVVPTEAKPGLAIRRCIHDGCTHTDEQELPAISPSIYKAEIITDRTCTLDGIIRYSISLDKGDFTFEVSKPAGHSLVLHQKIEATCEEFGCEAYYECSLCLKVFINDKEYHIADLSIDPLGHDYSVYVKTVAPYVDAKADGYDIYACSHDDTHTIQKNFVSWETLVTTVKVNVTNGNVSQEKEYSIGGVITLVAEEVTGRDFAGWAVDGEIVSTEKEYSFVITNAMQNISATYTGIKVIDSRGSLNMNLIIGISVSSAIGLVLIVGVAVIIIRKRKAKR